MRFATDEDEAVVSIVDVVRMPVVPVQPQLVVVVVNGEDVQVAVRVGCVWGAIYATTH